MQKWIAATPQERKQRRLLSSSTLQTVLQTLRTFICKLQGSQEDPIHVRDGFICTPCVRLLERYSKVHEEVVSNVTKALPVLRNVRHDNLGESAAISASSTQQPESSPSLTSSIPIPVLNQEDPNVESPALTVSS